MGAESAAAGVVGPERPKKSQAANAARCHGHMRIPGRANANYDADPSRKDIRRDQQVLLETAVTRAE